MPWETERRREAMARPRDGDEREGSEPRAAGTDRWSTSASATSETVAEGHAASAWSATADHASYRPPQVEAAQEAEDAGMFWPPGTAGRTPDAYDGRAGGGAEPTEGVPSVYSAEPSELVDDPWAGDAGNTSPATGFMAPDLATFLPPRRTPPASPASGYSHQQGESAVRGWWDVGSAEQVAAALEAVAQRVREGSLPVGEVDARAGESAAVAAALAALLGVKR